MASMSDEELRSKLLEYGEDFPVTESNRKILSSKLRRLITGERSRSRSAGRRSLIGFSSDESESEQRSRGANNRMALQAGAISSTTVSPLRRSRRSRTSLPGKDLKISNIVDSSSSSSSSTAVFTPPRLPTRRSTTVTETIHDGHGKPFSKTGSRASETKSPPSINGASAATGDSSSSRTLRTRSSTASKMKSVPLPDSNLDTSGSDSDISDSSISNIPENRGVDEFPRSRRSVITQADWCTPAANNRRRAENVDGGVPMPSASTVEIRRPHGRFGASGLSSTVFVDSKLHLNGQPEAMNTFDQSVSMFPNESHNNSQCVSMALVAVAVVFFVIVGLIYLGARHKDIVPYFVNDDDSTYINPICKMNSGERCLSMAAANHLKDILRIKAGDVVCYGSSLPNNMRLSYDDAVHLLQDFLKQQTVEMTEILYTFERNPQWGVRMLQHNGTPIINADYWRIKWFESAVPDLTLFCRLKLAFRNTVYKVLLFVALIVIVGGIGYMAYFWWQWNRQENEAVLALVEKILDILQNHHRAYQSDPSLQPYLALPHVRDMLIPVSDRKARRYLFDKAVRFIENNESRVRVETRSVEGEGFQVWRWLQPESKSPGGTTSGNRSPRIWQGQAFENLDTGMNALPCSPTPCLKVRNMFDPDVEYEDNWPAHIHDAILEKCDGAEIVHLRVDASSREGCVYIKCKDSETAGRVYKDLHGWWFDGKLVTVKYLRLERYHERFPEAANSVWVLRPIASSATGVRHRASNH